MVTAAQAQRQQAYRQALQNENVQRALASIRDAEGTANYAHPYNTAFGGSQLGSLATHPGISRRTNSSAAGAYQMLNRTWNQQATNLGLTDFSPENQDLAAVGLMDQRGALPSVYAGDVPGFASHVRNEWASFPGSPYGQTRRTVGQLQRAWDNYAPAPSAPLTGTQQQQATGIMGVINPATVGPVERRALAPPTTTASMFGPMTPAQSMKSQLDSYHTGIAATQAALANQNYDPSMQARLTQQDMDFANTGIGPSTPAGMMAKNALRTGLLSQAADFNQATPAVTPGYQDPRVTTAYQSQPQTAPAIGAIAQQAPQTNVNQPTQSQEQSLRGLMSPQEYGAYQTNKASLDAAAPNHSINMAHVGQMAQKGLGAIAGGLLGGLTLGPIGGLLGGYIGKQIASPNGLMGNNNFPTKPDSTPKGDGGLTAAGQAAMHNSPQFGAAMAKGGIGLY